MTDNNGAQIFTEDEQSRAKGLWQKCRTFLSTMLSEQDLRNWIEPIEPQGLRAGELVLRVSSEAFYVHLEEHYTKEFNLMSQIYLTPDNVAMVFEFSQTLEETIQLAPTGEVSAKERKVEDYVSAFNEALSFETFIESDCNHLARAVAESVAMRPGQAPLNVLFIYGPSGVGKTHLSQAIGQRVRLLHPEKRLCYVSCSKFELQYANDARYNGKAAFLEFYQQMDVLIIDDIQGLIGKEATQQAFFEIFNHLSLLNKQIILTCDVPPAEFYGIEERILTRIRASMMIPLARPDLELRRKILRSRVAKAGITLGEEVVEYIANNMQSNVRELEGAMTTLLTMAQLQRKPIDLTIAAMVMGQSISLTKPTLTLEDIARYVAEEFDIEVDDLRSNSRARKFAQPRQVVMYLCRKHTEQTLKAIAKKLRLKQHTTVMHGVEKVEDLMAQDAEFRSQVEGLEQRMLARG